ncbi:hypothetical protein Xbud_01824 [Xenorhabdus budapestensis]|uniref:Uncharacterized protein n=1 Tax=Xenorhabdus budapestensis TaxID=290110 RepID=A0A2D0J1U9_XENBU|nr:hypothetical protein Xbud_01824 [Xenorhabdus budapestensis]
MFFIVNLLTIDVSYLLIILIVYLSMSTVALIFMLR